MLQRQPESDSGGLIVLDVSSSTTVVTGRSGRSGVLQISRLTASALEHPDATERRAWCRLNVGKTGRRHWWSSTQLQDLYVPLSTEHHKGGPERLHLQLLPAT